MASVAAFLPPVGPGQVLIPSQTPAWPPGQALLDVPMLDQGVAAGFLASRAADPDRQVAGDLADMLGGLPLALEQAAAYMQATGEPWPVTWPCSGRGRLLQRMPAAQWRAGVGDPGQPAPQTAARALVTAGKRPGQLARRDIDQGR